MSSISFVCIHLLLSLATATAAGAADSDSRFLSHPPMRPLPAAVERPRGSGPSWFVDPAKGDDGAKGTHESPWRTIGHALGKLQPGDTLYLRGGTYYERVTCRLSGTKDRPVVIRSYPGELAIINGGYREFIAFSDDWRKPHDVRLREGSPAIDAGIQLPPDWRDPLRSVDKGTPDMGAMPFGADPWRVGVDGRTSVFGHVR